jgi:signal transduction histidine kinase
LFRPFSSTKDGGFGIGAFQARQLATAMGGTLTVDSREGEGTIFTLTLPRADVSGHSANTSEAA